MTLDERIYLRGAIDRILFEKHGYADDPTLDALMHLLEGFMYDRESIDVEPMGGT